MKTIALLDAHAANVCIESKADRQAAESNCG